MDKTVIKIFAILAVIGIIGIITNNETYEHYDRIDNDKTFRILSSISNSVFSSQIVNYGEKNDIDIEVTYLGDLEIVDELNNNNNYDAVWISNSMWLYMLDDSSIIKNSKSISIDPIVIGIKRKKAEQLNLINKDIYNKDILNLINNGDLKYVMASVTKTNTGLSAYLGFLNSLAGSKEVLTEEDLNSETLITDLKNLFKGVERVSGDESYLKDMFLDGDYEAIINYESTLLDMNSKSSPEEQLYLLYPVDGVSMNDNPFAYVERKQKKEDDFNKIQKFLLNNETKKILESKGKRTWYGGINNNAHAIFDKNNGTDTNKYLVALKYPSKKVINKALEIYITELRKPNHTVFCLDLSGSMKGDGLASLKDAMKYILDYDEAAKDNLQFAKNDKVTIITFDHRILKTYETRKGTDIEKFITEVDNMKVSGSTNIYDPTIKALKILSKEDPNEYTTTTILMTDGESNEGEFSELDDYYNNSQSKIPVYSIMFGDSSETQLMQIANLTNGRIFDGKNGLKQAFSIVRSYN